jgi:hypothetical protein
MSSKRGNKRKRNSSDEEQLTEIRTALNPQENQDNENRDFDDVENQVQNDEINEQEDENGQQQNTNQNEEEEQNEDNLTREDADDIQIDENVENIERQSTIQTDEPEPIDDQAGLFFFFNRILFDL